MAKLFFPLFLLVSLLIGCRDTPCERASVIVGLVGFLDAEIDSVVIESYQKGTQFMTRVDSTLFLRTRDHFSRRGDTVLLLEPLSNLTSDFDYLLRLPKAISVYRLTEIIEQQTEGGNKKTACINPIKSFRVNGQLVDGNGLYNYMYLAK
jgi:hypothetical protein